jgi:hypothetical protein
MTQSTAQNWAGSAASMQLLFGVDSQQLRSSATISGTPRCSAIFAVTQTAFDFMQDELARALWLHL